MILFVNMAYYNLKQLYLVTLLQILVLILRMAYKRKHSKQSVVQGFSIVSGQTKPDTNFSITMIYFVNVGQYLE